MIPDLYEIEVVNLLTDDLNTTRVNSSWDYGVHDTCHVWEAVTNAVNLLKRLFVEQQGSVKWVLIQQDESFTLPPDRLHPKVLLELHIANGVGGSSENSKIIVQLKKLEINQPVVNF
jgi:hypothetical protein